MGSIPLPGNSNQPVNENDLLLYDIVSEIPDFEYQQLKPGTKGIIRLLEILPGVPAHGGVLCTLFEAEFTQRYDLIRVATKAPVNFAALSWKWGDESNGKFAISIIKDGVLYRKRVSETLGLALKNLKDIRSRIVWVDAICINQKDDRERSHQVSMMARIYTAADEVCVWLGMSDEDSKTAIKFVKEEIATLKRFDKLCTDPEHAHKWRSLLRLMEKPWFSRRWVVQEIALARRATVWCGSDSVPWRELAIAVELFVEVESATHRLSELMKKDDKEEVIPNYFEHIWEAGASQLVKATAEIFREEKQDIVDQNGFRSPRETQHTQREEIKELNRRSVLSLEYLVTNLSNFGCGRAHDSIYALLAIARDATPFPPRSWTEKPDEALIADVFSDIVEQRAYPLDYTSSYPDACKEFVFFCIERCAKTDPTQALNILCRPWANDTVKEFDKDAQQGPSKRRRLMKTKSMEPYTWKDDVRQKVKEWFPPPHHPNSGDKPEPLDLPSWVARVSAAPFGMFKQAGMEDNMRMGRKNANPLVGLPRDGHRNYSAGQSKAVDLKTIRFRKREKLGHYSLYVKGIHFDKVVEVGAASQGGNIPAAWLKIAGWPAAANIEKTGDPGDPPEAFWRTLVADRGQHERNPPYYYSRACKETIEKGGLASNRVDTQALIDNERNSIVIEFCRRVQEVIWNRALIKTKGNALGMASENVKEGDLVCIIYGCTVPVILRKGDRKTGEDLEKQQLQDLEEIMKRLERKAVEGRARKAWYQEHPHQKYKDDIKKALQDFKEKNEGDNQQENERQLTEDEQLKADEDERLLQKDLEEFLGASEDDMSEDGAGKDDDEKDDSKSTDGSSYERDQWRPYKEPKAPENPQEEKPKSLTLQKRAAQRDQYRHFKFIGEAYIHGFMDGKAIRNKFRNNTPDHVFELR